MRDHGYLVQHQREHERRARHTGDQKGCVKNKTLSAGFALLCLSELYRKGHSMYDTLHSYNNQHYVRTYGS
jgi:hypothetical protein